MLRHGKYAKGHLKTRSEEKRRAKLAWMILAFGEGSFFNRDRPEEGRRFEAWWYERVRCRSLITHDMRFKSDDVPEMLVQLKMAQEALRRKLNDNETSEEHGAVAGRGAGHAGRGEG
jgi:hypothetical protein